MKKLIQLAFMSYLALTSCDHSSRKILVPNIKVEEVGDSLDVLVWDSVGEYSADDPTKMYILGYIGRVSKQDVDTCYDINGNYSLWEDNTRIALFCRGDINSVWSDSNLHLNSRHESLEYLNSHKNDPLFIHLNKLIVNIDTTYME